MTIPKLLFSKKHIANYKIFLLVLLFLGALLLRFYDLEHIPFGIHGDESEFGLLAKKVIAYQYGSFFSVADTGSLFSVSVLGMWVQAIFIKLFGASIFALRFSSALAGFLTVIAFFFLARLMFKNSVVTYLVTLALATSHWHIAYSRLAMPNIWTPFFLVVICYFFLKGMQQKTVSRYFAFAGVFLGLSQYFQNTVKIIPLICFLWCVVYFFSHLKKKRLVVRNILLLFLTGALVFLPQAVYFLQHPEVYVARMDDVSIFRHLPEYFVRYNVTTLSGVLTWQFINTMKVFNVGGDLGWYIYAYKGGLLAPIVGVFAAAGLFLALKTFRQITSQLLLIWFFAIIILGGMITVDAPSSPRLVGIIPVLFLFAGLVIERLLTYIKALLTIPLVILFLVNGFLDYQIYFMHYIHSKDGWAQYEPATQISYYVRTLGPEWKVYALRENLILTGKHGTIRYMNPLLDAEDVFASPSSIPAPVLHKNTVYIMPPGSPSLPYLQEHYPKGRAQYFVSPIDNIPSFTSYETPK